MSSSSRPYRGQDEGVEAAFFDLDKTVIARASMVAFGRPLYREGLISRWILLRARYGQRIYVDVGEAQEPFVRMRDSFLALIRGWHQDHVLQVVREPLLEVVEPIVYDEAVALMRPHQREGRRVFIVSASPEEIVEP